MKKPTTSRVLAQAAPDQNIIKTYNRKVVKFKGGIIIIKNNNNNL